MSTRAQYSEQEIERIGLRMKSARVLSGLNQEEFSNAHGIPYMSLKGWEMGKALPRQVSLLKFLSALQSNGILVDSEWLLCGSGAGPTLVAGVRLENPVGKSNYVDQQIALFKQEQISHGFNPLVIEVKDDLMSPAYKLGDIVGGIFINYEQVKAQGVNSVQKGAVFLARIDEGIFAPRQVFFCHNRLLISSFKEPELIEYGTQLLAKISWHYFPESHT